MRYLQISLLSFFFLVALSATAFAEDDPLDNDTDCDCAEGYECEVEVMEVCTADAMPACPPDDQDCVTEEPQVDCYEEAYTRCVAPPCDSDADCGGDSVCVEYVYEFCEGSAGCGSAGAPTIGIACPDNEEDCEMPEPEEPEECEEEEGTCQIHSERYCVPPYQAPCDADADCGPGFECVAATGPGCAVSSDDREDPEFSCEEDEPTEGPGRCLLIEQSCETDSDCGFDFECHIYDAPTVCTDGDDGGDMMPPVIEDNAGEGSDGDPGDGDDGGSEPEPEPEPSTCDGPVTTEGYCAPPGYYSGSRPGADYGFEGEPASGESADTSDDGTYSGAPQSGSNGELLDSWRVDGNDDDAAADGSASSCATVSGSQGAPMLLLLAMIAGAGVVRQRR